MEGMYMMVTMKCFYYAIIFHYYMFYTNFYLACLQHLDNYPYNEIIFYINVVAVPHYHLHFLLFLNDQILAESFLDIEYHHLANIPIYIVIYYKLVGLLMKTLKYQPLCLLAMNPLLMAFMIILYINILFVSDIK